LRVDPDPHQKLPSCRPPRVMPSEAHLSECHAAQFRTNGLVRAPRTGSYTDLNEYDTRQSAG
jgi:hypothetical protein